MPQTAAIGATPERVFDTFVPAPRVAQKDNDVEYSGNPVTKGLPYESHAEIPAAMGASPPEASSRYQ